MQTFLCLNLALQKHETWTLWDITKRNDIIECGWLWRNWPSGLLLIKFHHLYWLIFSDFFINHHHLCLFLTVCIGQRQFHDQYFDTPQFDLTLKDMWLRNRKGCWELKCPTAGDRQTEETSGEQSKTVALCSRYKEITNLPDIQLKLKEVIKDVYENMDDAPQEQKATMTETFQQAAAAQHGLERAEGKYAQEDESWLRKMNLVSFAAFTTVRRSFTLEEEGVQIDLDQADFGYHVGEIEVLIPEGGDLQAALEKIERTAHKLGELIAELCSCPRCSFP